MMFEPQSLVEARLYPSQEAVIQDALRSLLQEKPQLRIELAIHQYETEDISLAKAAHLAGLSYDSMKALLVRRSIPLRLGPASEAEAVEEVRVLDHLLREND
jgi:predicted HTH domain antitoxin